MHTHNRWSCSFFSLLSLSSSTKGETTFSRAKEQHKFYFTRIAGELLQLIWTFWKRDRKRTSFSPPVALLGKPVIFCGHNSSISPRTANLTISSRRGGGSVPHHLLFLTHFCCPAASPINQSGSEARRGMSLSIPLVLLDCVCVCVFRQETKWKCV